MSVTLLKLEADLNLSLAAAVSVGGTTATLSSAVNADGDTLVSGKYGFTIDGGNSAKEFIICDLVGTALTNVLHVDLQGATSSGFQNYHRIGATVTITDWAILSRILNNLNGTTGFDSGTPIKYDAEPSYSDPLTIPTVQFVLDTASGGAVTFNATTIAGDAGETIVEGEWVYYNTTDGEWYKTDADDVSKSVGVQIGKARGAGTNGNAISGGIFVEGQETEGTYVAGTTYYLSNTAGELSTSAGTNSVVVGVGDANGDLILRKSTPSMVDAQQGGGAFGTPSSANKFTTDDYFDDPANFIRGVISPQYLPEPMYQQDITLGSNVAVTNPELAFGSSNDGSVIYGQLQDGTFQRFERDSVTGLYLLTHTINPTIAINATDTGSIIQIGIYIYFFTNDHTNIICSRFLAADLTGEQVMTVPTVASTGNVLAWTDGTNAYVCSDNSATTSRTWTLSGTTFTASTTDTITSLFTDITGGYSTFYDGTNAYIVGAVGNVFKIKKLNTITGTSTTITTKTLASISDAQLWCAGVNMDSSRMYLGGFFPVYDETGLIITYIRMYPITKP